MSWKRCLPITLLFLLLAFPSIAIEGASSGILLWFNVVLPTLSPFIICTQAIVASGGVTFMMRPIYPVFKRMFGVSVSGAYILLCGFLCGYPLGARLCAEFRQRGEITPQESNMLFAICNHPSPMFLLGYVRSQIPFPVPIWLLLICLYLPVIPISLLARRVYGICPERKILKKKQLIYDSETEDSASKTPPSLEEIIHSTCETMVLIGGYIMLFSILVIWVQNVPILTNETKALIAGTVEITTGIHMLCTTLPGQMLLPAVLASVAFGGISGIFQTKSVIGGSDESAKKSSEGTKNTGLSVRHYVLWKLLHACLTCVAYVTLTALI